MCYVPAATTSFSWASCKIIRKITPVSWHSPTMWSTALLTPAANRCLRCMVRLFQHWTSVLHACAHRRRQPLGGPAPPLPPCSFSICNIEATKRGGAPPPENKKNGCQLYLRSAYALVRVQLWWRQLLQTQEKELIRGDALYLRLVLRVYAQQLGDRKFIKSNQSYTWATTGISFWGVAKRRVPEKK